VFCCQVAIAGGKNLFRTDQTPVPAGLPADPGSAAMPARSVVDPLGFPRTVGPAFQALIVEINPGCRDFLFLTPRNGFQNSHDFPGNVSMTMGFKGNVIPAGSVNFLKEAVRAGVRGVLVFSLIIFHR